MTFKSYKCIKSYGYGQEHELFYVVCLLDGDDVQYRKPCISLRNDESAAFDQFCLLVVRVVFLGIWFEPS